MAILSTWKTRTAVALAAAAASVATMVVGGQAPAQAAPSVGTSKPALTTSCPSPHLWQPFAYMGNYAWYYALKGGDFETTGHWTMSGAASIVWGNETQYINPLSPNKKSLRLDNWGSVTQTFTCVPASLAWGAFFKVPANSPGSILLIEVRSTDPVTGKSHGYSWRVNAVDLPLYQGRWIAATLLMPDPVGTSSTQTVKMTFQVVGGGSWQIDDIVMDPWRSYR